MNYERLNQLTEEVAILSREVGQFLLEERRQFNPRKIEQKGFNNLVSYVDEEAEKRFVKRLSEILPEAGFIAEEGTGKEKPGGLNWVIDPLDGTTNYIHDIPFYCTSVALVENRQPLLGVVFDPVRDELFCASTETTAVLNGQDIAVSEVKNLSAMLMATGFPYDDKGWLEANLKTIGELTRMSRGIRRLGSAALDMCYVACGRLDGFYEVGLNPWDVAAATCIIRQAGGKVDDFEQKGDPLFSRRIIAASPPGFDALHRLIERHFVS